MDRRTFLATGVMSGVALAGCLEGSGEPTGDYDVGMTIDSFRPETLTVDAGTTVEFRNTSSHTHTVTAFQGSYPEDAEYWASGGFESRDEAEDAWKSDRGGAIEQGESYEHAFEQPGSHGYFCIPHLDADMVGQIDVEE